MKTAPHHFEGKKCLIEIHNSKTQKSDFVKGNIKTVVSSLDTDYRINVITEDGREFNECHPDCVLPYFYISARSAWDIVKIGPYKDKKEAINECIKSNWNTNLVKEA